ncbi:hypothetical protein CSC88_25860, partial [Klebsiella pneumoniae]
MAKTRHDGSGKEDTRYETLPDHNIVGISDQHMCNFRFELAVDVGNNPLVAMDPAEHTDTADSTRPSTIDVLQ